MVSKRDLLRIVKLHVAELQRLHKERQQLLRDAERIEKEIAAKQALVEDWAGLPWSEIEPVLPDAPASNGATQKFTRSDSKKKSPVKTKTVRLWVLRAIEHYEDNNPQSRIDEGSIRIYIDAASPGFLDRYTANTLYTALNALKHKGLVITAPGRGSHPDRSQYCLTAKGRAALNEHRAEQEVQNG